MSTLSHDLSEPLMDLGTLKRHPIVGWVAVHLLALLVFVWSPYASEWPMAALSIVAFILVQIFMPACRPVTTSWICPANIAQLFFWVQLVPVTLLVGFYGISQATLPKLPSNESLNLAICLRIVGYISFCAGYQYLTYRRSKSKGAESGTSYQHYQKAQPVVSKQVMSVLILLCVALGLLGFYLTYGSVGGFISFISSPVEHKEREQLATTVASASATFLRPFLGFAMVLAWSWWIGRRDKGISTAMYAGVTVLLVPLLLFANFNFNRGSMLAPIIAVLAVYSLHVQRISLAFLVVGGIIALGVLFTFGWYRATDLQLSEVSSSDLGENWNSGNMVEFVQVYASGPQLAGYLLDERGAHSSLYYGQTILASVIYPVPIVGKPFRELAGVTIFNRAIYGDPEISDQIIPYDAELHMNFHVPGIIAGYAILGCLLYFLQRRFLLATQPIESYIWLLFGFWAVFPGSLSVLSQCCVYSFCPFYLYGVGKLLGKDWKF